MNKLTIIGNLTKEPELRSTQDGISVCGFTVAVNRKYHRDGEPEADFVRVSVWREKGENCAKYLQKGSKVCVVGAASASAYMRDGVAVASLEIKAADEVEFISRPKEAGQQDQPNIDQQSGFEAVETDELPF